MEDKSIKVVFLGASEVGKTCLISRYINGNMGDGISTEGARKRQKKIEVNGAKYLCDIYDLSGHEKYRPLTKFLVNDSKIIVLVYDITKKSSFIDLEFWLDIVLEKLGNEVYLVLVGNKKDLIEKEEINEEQGRKFAEIINANFALVSAEEEFYSQWNNFLENEIKNYIIKS